MKVENLSKTYRTKGAPPVQALKGVSFTLPDTGMVFLLGRSGSGKTTDLFAVSLQAPPFLLILAIALLTAILGSLVVLAKYARRAPAEIIRMGQN